tara:strand:+ start:653 stop:1057 length:405 start_codon:yes stop_codon:yes gene_type:complete
MTNKNFSKGFTLIEIMVVLIIIAIMASFIVPSVINRPDEARITKVKNDIMVLEGALDLFRLDNGRYPSNTEGLNVLISNEKSYLKRLPLDPWGSSYQYSNPGIYSLIDIYSFGADQKLGGEKLNEDIGNWNLID